MALPAEESAELHNKLVHFDPETDLAQMKRAVWQLRKLDRSGFDVRTRVALLSGLVRSGDRSEADDLLETLLPHAHSMDLEVIITFASTLLSMARVEDFAPMYRDLLSRPGGAAIEAVARNAELGAFLGGDLALLQEIDTNDQVDSKTRETVRRRLAAIRMAKIDDSFAAHQRVVNSVIGPFQTGATASLVVADDEYQITCKRQIAGDKTVRHRLLGELREALVSLYESLGHEDAVERINILGTAIVSHPAYLRENHAAA